MAGEVLQRFDADITPAVQKIDQLIAKLVEYQKTVEGTGKTGADPKALTTIGSILGQLRTYRAATTETAKTIESDINSVLIAYNKLARTGAIGTKITGGIRSKPLQEALPKGALTERQAAGTANVGARQLLEILELIDAKYRDIIDKENQRVAELKKHLSIGRELAEQASREKLAEQESERLQSPGAISSVIAQRAHLLQEAQKQIIATMAEARRLALRSVTTKEGEKAVQEYTKNIKKLYDAEQALASVQERIRKNSARQNALGGEIRTLETEKKTRTLYPKTSEPEQEVKAIQDRIDVAVAEQNSLLERGNKLLDERKVALALQEDAQYRVNQAEDQNTAALRLSGTLEAYKKLAEQLAYVEQQLRELRDPGSAAPYLQEVTRIQEGLALITEELNQGNVSTERAVQLEKERAELIQQGEEALKKAPGLGIPIFQSKEEALAEFQKTAPLLQRTMVGAFSDMGRRFTATLQFAISGALIFGVQRMVRQLYQTAVDVERAFADIGSALEFDIEAPRGSPEFERSLERIRLKVLNLANEYNTLPTAANKAAFVMVSRFSDVDDAMRATKAQLLATKISTIDESETLRALTAVAEGFAGAVINVNDGLTVQERLLRREKVAAGLYMKVLDIAVLAQQTYGVEVEDTLEGTARATETFKQMGFTVEQTAAMVDGLTRSLGITGSQAAEKLNRWVGQLTSPQIRDQLIDLAAQTDALSLSFKDFGSGAQAWYTIVDQFDRLQSTEPKLAQRLIQIVGQRRELESVAAALGTSSQQAELVANSINAAGAAEKRFQFVKATISEVQKSIATGFEELAQNIERLGLLTPIKILLKTVDAILKTVNAILRGFVAVKNVLNAIHIGDFGLGSAIAAAGTLLLTLKGVKEMMIAINVAATFLTKGKGLLLGGLGAVGVARGATAAVPQLLGPTGAPIASAAAAGSAAGSAGLAVAAVALVGKFGHAIGSVLAPVLGMEKGIRRAATSFGALDSPMASFSRAIRNLNRQLVAGLASGFTGQTVSAGESGLSFASGAALSRAAGPVTKKAFEKVADIFIKAMGFLSEGIGAFVLKLAGYAGIAYIAIKSLVTGASESAEAMETLSDVTRNANNEVRNRLAGTGATEAEIELEVNRAIYEGITRGAEDGTSSGLKVALQGLLSPLTFALNKGFRDSLTEDSGGNSLKALLRATSGFNPFTLFPQSNIKDFIPASEEWWAKQAEDARKAFLDAQLTVLNEDLGSLRNVSGVADNPEYQDLLASYNEVSKKVAEADSDKDFTAATKKLQILQGAIDTFRRQANLLPQQIEKTLQAFQTEAKRIGTQLQLGNIDQGEAAARYGTILEGLGATIAQGGLTQEEIDSFIDDIYNNQLSQAQAQQAVWDNRIGRLDLIASETLRGQKKIELLTAAIKSGAFKGEALQKKQDELVLALREQADRIAQWAVDHAKANVDISGSIDDYIESMGKYIDALEERQADLFRQRRVEEALALGQTIIAGKLEKATTVLNRQIAEKVAATREGAPIFNKQAQLQADLIEVTEKMNSYYTSDADKIQLHVRKLELLAQGEQLELDRLKEWRTLSAGVSDKSRALQAELANLNDQLALTAIQYGKNTAEYFQIQQRIEQVQNQIALNQIELAGVNMRLAGDITDPMNDAVASLAEIIAKLSAPDLGKLETAQLELQKKQAEAALYRTNVEGQLFNLKFQFDTGSLSLSGYIGALKSMRDAIDTTTRQGKELWEEINGLIEGLQNSANQAFNIPTEIRLPTLFEVRRAVAADQLGVNYQDNRTQEVNVYVNDNVDATQFARDLDAVLGTSFANNTRRNAPGLAPLTLGSI